MMMPLALKTGPPTYQPELQPHIPPQFMETLSPETSNTKGPDSSRALGPAQQPDLFPSSLVFLSGLIAALIVYAILKKRTI